MNTVLSIKPSFVPFLTLVLKTPNPFRRAAKLSLGSLPTRKFSRIKIKVVGAR